MNVFSATPTRQYLALDLGATSGRAMLGAWDGRQLAIRELSRFRNAPLPGAHGLVWPFAQIMSGCVAGIAQGAAAGPLAGVACDAWAVDHGLLDDEGQLLAPPFSYQDAHRTQSGAEELRRFLSPRELFQQAGSPYIAISTAHQLLATRAMAPGLLQRAEHLLMLPELVAHALCGATAGEFSSASTTALCDWRTRAWNRPLLRRLALPDRILPPLREAGVPLAPLRTELRHAHGLPDVQVHLVAGHDTASAVIGSGGAPTGELVISSGTWLMLAVRVDQPNLSEAAFSRTIGAYGLPGGAWMMVAGIMGLYLLERLRSEEAWPEIPELCSLAEQAPALAALFDPTDEALTGPGRLRQLLQQQAGTHGTVLPENTGTLARSVMEVLALYAAESVELLEALSGISIRRLHVVGGGVRNRLLNQMLADATDRPVLAGDAEAAARGNVALQLLATGEAGSLAEACTIAREGTPLTEYEPRPGDWPAARARFAVLRAQRGSVDQQPGEGVADAGTVAGTARGI